MLRPLPLSMQRCIHVLEQLYKGLVTVAQKLCSRVLQLPALRAPALPPFAEHSAGMAQCTTPFYRSIRWEKILHDVISPV